jgi:DNA repair protein RadC
MQAKNYAIKEWAKADRPREKMMVQSSVLLSDSELLAILIRTGTRDRTALDLARELLQKGGNNLRELGNLSAKELMSIKGIGAAKAVTIRAALELGRRRQSFSLPDRPQVKDSRELASYLQDQLRDHQHEVFGVVFLNRANKVKHLEIISQGGITGTVADPRIILKKALEQNAVSLILYHNHPSGNFLPSLADEQLTAKIKEATRYFDIRLLDHIIVSDEGYFSFADQGLL